MGPGNLVAEFQMEGADRLEDSDRTIMPNEIRLVGFLENANSVKWWLKNAANGKKRFAIRHTDPDDGYCHAFYAGIAVRMIDGRIGPVWPKGWVDCQDRQAEGRGTIKAQRQQIQGARWKKAACGGVFSRTHFHATILPYEGSFVRFCYVGVARFFVLSVVTWEPLPEAAIRTACRPGVSAVRQCWEDGMWL